MGEGFGVLLALVSSCLGGTAAAVTRYLVGTFGPHPVFAVIVNYSDKTARNVFSTTAVWLPAQITDRMIKWTNLIRYPDGNTLKDYWSMDRYSGLLTRADAGTAHCAKPAPKLQQVSK